MEEDADLFDDAPPLPRATLNAPPSPLATSTQLPPASAGGFFPPLPQLPGISRDNAEPLAGGSRPLDLSPIVDLGTRLRTRTRHDVGRNQNTSARRVSRGRLEGWVIRPVQPSQLAELPVTAQQNPDVVEIDDNSDSESAESIHSESSYEGIVVDSDVETSDNEVDPEQDVVIQDQAAQQIDVVREETVTTEQEVVNVPDEQATGSVGNPGEPVAGSAGNTGELGARSADNAGESVASSVGITGEPATGNAGEAVAGSEGNGRELVAGSAGNSGELVAESAQNAREAATGSTETAGEPGTGSAAEVPSTPGSVPVQPLSAVRALVTGSPADFRSPAKRRRVISPEKPAAKGGAAVEEEEEDGESCPICFESWTTSGGHRLASLRCGHLFGQSCIDKWLKGQGGKCPQCNAKAKRHDIRVLYAKSIKAVDTTEKERALRDLEKEREVRRRCEMDSAQLRLQYQQAIQENNSMRLEIERLKAQIRRAGGSAPSTSTSSDHVNVKANSQEYTAGRFILDKTIKIYDGGNCRVMTYCPSLVTLVASQPSSSQLFPGFGMKKINLLDVKSSQYVTIHGKAIRDVAFMDNMLLTCGLDKKVKLTSLLSNAVVQAYDTPMPAWSCAWNGNDANYFYAGLQNGGVLEFDVRNTDGPVAELNKEGSRSPVAALLYVNRDMGADFRCGGLMVGQLDRVTFFESQPSGERRPHLLPMEGLLTSLSLEPDTRHILASFRPTARHPAVRHQLCELVSQNISGDPSVVDTSCSCNVIHTFHGGRTQTVLSRSTLLQHPGDRNRLLVAGGDETSNCVHIWDSGTGQKHQSLQIGGTVVDLCSFTLNDTVHLAALTDKQCKLFKWT